MNITQANTVEQTARAGALVIAAHLFGAEFALSPQDALECLMRRYDPAMSAGWDGTSKTLKPAYAEAFRRLNQEAAVLA